jgi:hypothetical protein
MGRGQNISSAAPTMRVAIVRDAFSPVLGERRGSDRPDEIEIVLNEKVSRIVGSEIEMNDPLRRLVPQQFQNYGDLYQMSIDGVFAGITDEYGTCLYSAFGFRKEDIELAIDAME